MTTTTTTKSDRAEWHARDATPAEALNALTERAAKLEAENARLRRELDEARRERDRVAPAEPAPLTPERAAILDDAAEATARMFAAIQEQARDGESPDQTVERLIRERSAAEKERKKLSTRVAVLRTKLHDAREQLQTVLDEAFGMSATMELPEGNLPPPALLATIQTAIPAIRAGLDTHGESGGVQERIAAHEALDALADAVAGAEPAAVMSAVELEVVRGVLETMEAWLGSADADRPAFNTRKSIWTRRWIEAGRPLASEGKEG